MSWRAAYVFPLMFRAPDHCMLHTMSDVATSELPTGTVTLLLADVEGSTRLWQNQPDEMTAAVAALERAVCDVVAAHAGVRPVEQGEGDSFVVAFTRASDAVSCALELQRALIDPIRLRIGLHTGQVQLRDEGNYSGPTINRTARLRDLAHGGQTVLSGATEQLVVDWLPDDVWLRDLGTHQLRDLPRPERVVQLCHPDLRSEFPPLRAPQHADAHNLPTQLTSFIGRGAQMADVQRQLADNRMVTLTGAGGAGKTRLAVEVAARTASEFTDGVWYVDLAPTTHHEAVPVVVARALRLPDQLGRSTVDTLTRFVGDRQALIVLDNCEHLLDATSSLAMQLLETCAALRILATSREPTGVVGEVTYQVPSLALADEAIELFADRARRVRPEFAVTDDNVTTVTEICRRLDGMPLAIELAAARVRALSLDEILGSLHDRFLLLTGGARTAVRRQQTLRASVDWSHALLTEPERVLFRRLAAFPGDFDLDAAQKVAGGTEVERFQLLDQLSLLVDKSLVAAERSSGGTRYRMLETVRQYASEKLGESGEGMDVRSRHRDHYTAMAALLDAPSESGIESGLQRSVDEMDNLRSAFGWSLETGDVGHALELASALQPLWLSTGWILEGLAWLEAGLADNNAEVPPVVLAKARADKVMLLTWVALTSSVDDANRALDVAREVDDPGLLIRALVARALVCANDGAASQAYFAEAEALARELGDSWRLSQILSRRMGAVIAAGDVTVAEMVAGEGLEIAEAIGDRANARICRWGQGWTWMARGDLMGALNRFDEIVDEAAGTHDEVLRLYGLLLQAFSLAYLGDGSRALASADVMLEAALEFGEYAAGPAYGALGIACLATDDPVAARAAFETARRLSGMDPLPVGMFAWAALGPLACGDAVEARRWADDIVALTTGVYHAVALAVRARVEIVQGEEDRAEQDAHAALSVAVDNGAILGLSGALECIAELATTAGSHREATRLFAAADAVRGRTGEVRLPMLNADHRAVVDELRKTMGDEDFDATWAEGAALTVDEAIAYAQRGRGERKRPSNGWASLTPAELDVVRLVTEGLANKAVATKLFVSPRTVETHLSHVYAKLGVASRVQLVGEASRHTG
jgi:predicted ATPase/class 3 adenylate cyclase/DNA-binding CsgD family transcriptional regulator